MQADMWKFRKIWEKLFEIVINCMNKIEYGINFAAHFQRKLKNIT